MPRSQSLTRRLAGRLVGQKPAIPALSETSSAQSEHLEALLKEYELTFNALEQSVGRGIQLTTAAVGAIGAAVGLLPQANPYEHEWAIFWLPPLFLVILGIIIFEQCHGHAHIWSCRVIAQRLNSLLPEPALVRFEPTYPSATVFSVTRGALRVRLLSGIMIGGPFVLFFGLLFVLANFLSQGPRQLQWLFLGVWIPTFFAEVSLLTAPLFDIPARFRRFANEVGDGPFPQPGELRTSRPARRRGESPFKRFAITAFFWVLPRPWDFVCKAACFWIGMAAALVAVGLSSGQLQRMNTWMSPLLNRGQPWARPEDVPGLAIFLLGLLYFLVVEIGFQQAKFLLDDSRPQDVERDRTLLQNQRWRAVTAGVMSPSVAFEYAIYRGAASLAFGFVLGEIALVLVLGAIALHQLVYVFVFKPLGQRYPRLILLWIALNLTPRLLAGVIVIADAPWTSPAIAVLLATFFCSSLGGMAAQWKMEALHHGTGVRGQSAYLVEHGERWQHVGLFAAVLLASISLAFSIMPCLGDAPAQSALLPACTAAGGMALWLTSSPAAFVFGSIAIAVLALLLANYVIWPLWTRPRSTIAPAPPAGGSQHPHRALNFLGASIAISLVLAGGAAALGQWITGWHWLGWFGALLVVRVVLLIGGRGPARTAVRAPAKRARTKERVLQVLLAAGLALLVYSLATRSLPAWYAALLVMQLWLLIHFEGMDYSQFALGGMAASSDRPRKAEGRA